jgi:hypothetical protein
VRQPARHGPAAGVKARLIGISGRWTAAEPKAFLSSIGYTKAVHFASENLAAHTALWH